MYAVINSSATRFRPSSVKWILSFKVTSQKNSGELYMAKKKIYSIKDELLKKARESMLAAVEIYNNPNITFKAETFITLAIISWTYVMHAYYKKK